MTNGEQIAQGNWVLINREGGRACIGDRLVDFRGDVSTLTGGRPPHKPSSNGFVESNGFEYYAKVFGLEWVDFSKFGWKV